jgi:ribosomal protein S18 acetylase RimI-like enzyme
MTPIIEAARIDELEEIRTLFREYESEIGIDLCFQGFEQELADLPGKYALPRGRLLIARIGNELCGCIALRPLLADNDVCEMKRLFIRRAYRGMGLARRLVERLFEEARSAGYRTMRLDTLASMADALALYRSLGFREIPAYYASPLPGTVYLEFDLTMTPPIGAHDESYCHR